MSDRPRHPDGDTDTRTEHEPDASRSSSRGTYVLAALVLLSVLAVAALHVTGAIGAGSH